MKNKFSQVKKDADIQMKMRRRQRDEEDRVLIHMTVKNDENFLSVFSESETPVISTEVAEFIENSTHSVPPRESLTLRIHSRCIDDREKVLYKKAIKEYYMEKYIANEQELKRNRLTVLLLTMAGVATLAAALLFDYHIGNAIWSEVIDIVAWVFLWEAVDIGVFENRMARSKKLRYLAFLSMKVAYVEDEPLD